MKFHIQYMHLFPFFFGCTFGCRRYSRESMDTREKLKETGVKTLTNAKWSVDGCDERDIFKKKKHNVAKFVGTMYYRHKNLKLWQKH